MPHRLFGRLRLGMWILLMLACLPLTGSSQTAASGASAMGLVEVEPAAGSRLKVAFADLFAPPLTAAARQGWLHLLEHELLYRPGFEGRYDVVAREDVRQAVTEAKLQGVLVPQTLPVLKAAINADVFVFLDMARLGRDWTLRARLYSGRTGAYLAAVRVPYTFEHLRWTEERLLVGLDAKLRPGTAPTDLMRMQPPSDVILPGALEGLDALKTACLDKRCLSQLGFLEWLQEHNPEFFERLNKNPLYLNAAYKEGEDAVSLARINMLGGNLQNAALKLKQELDAKNRRPGQDRALLEYLGRAHMALNQPQDAKQVLTRLLSMDPGNTYARWALGKLACERREWPSAFALLGPLANGATPPAPEVAQTHLTCLRDYRPDDKIAIAKAKERLMMAYLHDGDVVHANALALERLDQEVSRATLDAIHYTILSDADLKNVATILGQRSIVHDDLEAVLLWRLSQLRWEDGHRDEAPALLESAVKLAPHDARVLEDAAWQALERQHNPIGADKYLGMLPEAACPPFLATLVALANKQDERALELLQHAAWPPELAYERARLTALTQAARQNWLGAREALTQAEALYRGGEELTALKAEQKALVPDEAERQTAAAESRLLEGAPLALGTHENDVFATDYARMLAPLPLVGFDTKGAIKGLGRVAVLRADPPPPSAHATLLDLFLERKPGRLADEWQGVLAERYHALDTAAGEATYRAKLTRRLDQPFEPKSKSELLTLASSLGADSLILVSTQSHPEPKTETAAVSVQILLYDGVGQNVFVIQHTRSEPFFSLYRFNMNWIIAPLILLVLLGFSLFFFYRAMAHWANPLARARHLAKHRHFLKAAQVLERHGYIQDGLAMRGHHHASEQNYLLALDAFYRARDFTNAQVALKFCPDNAQADQLAAELFFLQRDYERAEHYYRRLKSLPGLAKIAEARHDAMRAARIMGQYYFEAGNYAAAVAEYTKVNDHERAGLVLFHAENYREAALKFKQAGNEKMYKKCLLRLGIKAEGT